MKKLFENIEGNQFQLINEELGGDNNPLNTNELDALSEAYQWVFGHASQIVDSWHHNGITDQDLIDLENALKKCNDILSKFPDLNKKIFRER